MTFGLLAQSLHQPVASAWHALVLAAAAGAGWVWHACRGRADRSELARLVGQRAGDGAGGRGAAEGEAGVPVVAAAPEGGEAAEEASPMLVLAVAAPSTRALVEARLAGLSVELTAADTEWAARVACREAFAAGRPYNLVLLDASLEEVHEPEQPACLQDDLQAWGSRVAVIRAARGRKEGSGCDEDPDRRGRARLAAAAGTRAAALGPRGLRLH